MVQTRIFLRARQEAAHRYEAAIEDEFAGDGHAIASFEIDEPEKLWEVALYCDNRLADGVFARMRSRMLDPGIELRREDLPETDWVALSLEGLKPVSAGRYLVYGSHDRAARRPWHVAIEIDAGQAFGTGHHGTTAGCLLAIGQELRRRRFQRILDLGTGSGVLAIALAKTQHRPVLASDIDPVAVQVARRNFAINGVARLAAAVVATGFQHRAIAGGAPFDLIVANILARPLQNLAPAFARHAAPGAIIILSGLLASQCWQVVAAFRTAGFALRRRDVLDGWATLVLRKSG